MISVLTDSFERNIGMPEVKSKTVFFTTESGNGKYRLHAVVILYGKDIGISVTGGDRPHIGAVAVAQCAPGINRKERLNVSVSVITLTGHKEDEIAKTMAMKLSREFSVNVMVSAGMHWDVISTRGINAVCENSRKLSDAIIKEINKIQLF